MAQYIDLETTSLDPRSGDVRMVSINGEVFDLMYGPSTDRAYVRKYLNEHKEDTFVAHNAQFDLDWLYEKVDGFEWTGPIFDSMVAYQLWTNGKGMSASLDNVARHILKIDVDKTFQSIDWSAPFLEEDAYNYAAEDTRILEPLHAALVKKLKTAGLENLFKMEMEILPALVAAKRRGVKLDVPSAKRLSAELGAEAKRIERELPQGLNARAPVQVASYFGIQNAQEDTIREYVNRTQNPTAQKVMDIKKALKRKSTIEKQLLNRVSYDGRIHPNFKQTATETGRFSSTEPNLQNQDRGKAVRSLFVPERGNKLVVADYSQIEVRIAALLSGDPVMLQAYADGRDLHQETQLRTFGDPSEMDSDTRKRTRSLSKNINFAYLFGGGHNTLVRFAFKQGIVIEENVAKQYHRIFHNTYPTLSKWQKKVGSDYTEYVYSIRGRRRYIEPGKAYCTRINHPVQSSAADGMKAAIWMLRKKDITPILNVHDELVVECGAEEAEEVRDLLVECMLNGMYWATKQDKDNPTIEIAVEADIGDSWAEAK